MRLVDNHTGLEVMDQRRCRELLGSQRVGRVAVVVGSAPLIFPVNYVMDGDEILFRTAEGSKLEGAAGSYRMAFEIDGIDERAREGWSVVASGMGREVVEPNELERVRSLPLEPWAPGAKTHWIRIRPDILTGRRVAQP